MILEPLVYGTFIRRYKRFLVDVSLNGEIITAHCPNSGSLMGVLEEGACVILTRSDSKTRKYPYTFQFIDHKGQWVGVNTQIPNEVVDEALKGGGIPELLGYTSIQREVAYGSNCRIDFLLTDSFEASFCPSCYVEVKNVHLCRNVGICEFPDSITTRGHKHLKALTHEVSLGNRCVVLYCVQRRDCDTFKVACDIDPEYGRLALLAKEKGVEFLVYSTQLDSEGGRLTICIKRALMVV